MKKFISFLLAILSALSLLASSGCADKNKPNKNNPVTLSMWHNFGGDMQKTVDTLLDKFNSTIGKEKGIIINVTAVSSSAELQDNLNMIINGDTGAPEMPDIFTAYPKAALKFQEKDMLINFDDYFTKDEIEKYVPSYINEGRFGDGGLYVFPFAKSTEVLFLNKTIFSRFSDATGITKDELSTLEGIAKAAVKYYEWTDAQTPDIEHDGKAFFTADSWLNLSQTVMLQQDSMLFSDEKLDIKQDSFKRLWNTIYPVAVKGGFAVYDGYSSDLSRTGDIVCSIGSTAGVIFYGDTITYPDNTTEKTEFEILPYPCISGGKKYAIQRGNGLCVAKSTKKKEYAAAEFIKWLTESKQNMEFISSTGYLPVKNEAYEDELQGEINAAANGKVKSMLTASMKIYGEYNFFIPPNFSGFDDIGSDFESNFKAVLRDGREKYLLDKTLNIEKMQEDSLNSLAG